MMVRFTDYVAQHGLRLPVWAWRASWRQAGWLPAAGCAGLMGLLLLLSQTAWDTLNNLVPAVRVVEAILPLAAGMQAAFLFSPEDEPPLELLLAAERPLPWLLLERLLVLLGIYTLFGALATAAQFLLLADVSFGELLLRWLPPLLWLVALALFMTLLTRQGTLSALLVLLTWGGFLLSGAGLIAFCRMLLPLHLFLQPDLPTTSAAMYTYNRGMLLLTGGILLAFAFNLSRDEPRLMGERGWAGRQRRRPHALPDRFSYLWLALGLLCFYWMQPGQPGALWAAWLAPVFLLRFTRTQHPDPGLVIAVGATTAVSYAAWLEKTLLNDLCHALFAGQQALTFMLPFVVDRLLGSRRRGGFAGTLILPAAWVVVETATALFNVTFGSTGSIAYSQTGFLPLLQVTAVTGFTGVSFLIAWLASLVNWAFESRLRLSATDMPGKSSANPLFLSPNTLRPISGFLLYFIILILVVGGGWARLRFFPPQGERVSVAAFSLPQEDWMAQSREDAAATVAELQSAYLARTETELAAGAEVVVWPEANVVLLPGQREPFLQQARKLAQVHEAHLVLGVWDVPPEFPESLLRNESILVQPDGAIGWVYRKSIPVPGAEMSQPGEGVLPVAETDAWGENGRFSTAICYDMDFPHLIRQAGAAGVDVMWVPAHDINENFSPWHAQMGIFRAIENGFNLVRQTSAGLSLAADYQGRVLAQSDYFADADKTMAVQVPVKGVRTIYGRFGHWFAWTCLLLLLALSLPPDFLRALPGNRQKNIKEDTRK